MNSEQLNGRLREVKGMVLENLGRVVSDPWMRIAGRRERLLGQLQASLASSQDIADGRFAAARSRAPTR